MFIDETSIKARAGDGGRGCASFRREKYEPWGGPNGGDGGKGGDVVLRGDDDQNNLVDFKFKPHWNGERGEHGQGSDCNGREGRPAILRVPLGTVVRRLDTGEKVAEILADVPGLIAGASENKGLGHRFLKHIERCKLLLIILDLAGTDHRDPRTDYKQLLNELELYDPALLDKPRLVAANKMDEDAAVANLKKFKQRYPKVVIIPISCLSEAGIPKLKQELLKRVRKLRPKEKKSPKRAAPVS